MASATTFVTSAQDLMASSFPGITKSTSSGSQFVSTMATTGMPSLRASLTAMCSRLVSITYTAFGTRSMSWIPARLRSSFCFSWRSFRTSFFGRKSNAPDRSISRSSFRRLRRPWMVWKFVSMPPSHRVFT